MVIRNSLIIFLNTCKGNEVMRNILILEDKQSHMDALYKIVSEVNNQLRVFTASTEKEAFQIVMEQQIHLFLIDIILHPENPGDVSGLKFVREIRGIRKYQFTPLIFITSLEDPKLYSYSQLHCFGYIEKPFDVKQVQVLIAEALEFPAEDEAERSVYFRKDGILYAKSIKEIIYIENRKRKVTIHCKGDLLDIPYQTCDEILSEINSNLFVRCSRCAIVNKKFIEEIDYTNRYIKLKGIKQPVEIGPIWKKEFREKMGSR